VLLSTPIDYCIPGDAKAEKVLRAIQDRERNFQSTYPKDLYVKFSGLPEEEIKSINSVKHEWIDNSIKRLMRRDFIERIPVRKDKRRVELRSRPEEIYTRMIESEPMLFWNLLEKGYFYFIIRFSETNNKIPCPRCRKKKPLSLSISGNRASRYKISDELHIDIMLKHLSMEFSCDCGYSYSDEIDMYDPAALEGFSNLHDAASSRRNLL
jgi:hypothetical protein